MNHSEISWIAIRLFGLVVGFLALHKIIFAVAYSAFLIYLHWGETELTTGQLVAELSTWRALTPMLAYAVIYSLMSFYLLFRGGRFHAVLVRILMRSQP